MLLQNAKNPEKAVGDLQSENSALKKQLDSVTKTLAKALQAQLTPKLEVYNNIQFLATQVPLDVNGMKDLAFGLGKEHNNLFLVLGTVQNDKPMLACYISKDLVASSDLNACSTYTSFTCSNSISVTICTRSSNLYPKSRIKRCTSISPFADSG